MHCRLGVLVVGHEAWDAHEGVAVSSPFSSHIPARAGVTFGPQIADTKYAEIDQVALATLIGPWRNTEDSTGSP